MKVIESEGSKFLELMEFFHLVDKLVYKENYENNPIEISSGINKGIILIKYFDRYFFFIDNTFIMESRKKDSEKELSIRVKIMPEIIRNISELKKIKTFSQIRYVSDIPGDELNDEDCGILIRKCKEAVHIKLDIVLKKENDILMELRK